MKEKEYSKIIDKLLFKYQDIPFSFNRNYLLKKIDSIIDSYDKKSNLDIYMHVYINLENYMVLQLVNEIKKNNNLDVQLGLYLKYEYVITFLKNKLLKHSYNDKELENILIDKMLEYDGTAFFSLFIAKEIMKNFSNSKEELSKEIIINDQIPDDDISANSFKDNLRDIIKNETRVEELDVLENLFKQVFDISTIDKLNFNLAQYIYLRFGYLDGKTYSDDAILNLLTMDDIKSCRIDVLLYLKQEINNRLDIALKEDNHFVKLKSC